MKNLLIILAACLLFSCEQANESIVNQLGSIRLTVNKLPPLNSAYYEVWGTFHSFNKTVEDDSPRHEGEFVSFGKFMVGADGTLEGITGGPALLRVPAGQNLQLLRDVVIAVQLDHSHGAHTKGASDEPGSVIIGGLFRGDAHEAVAEMNMAYADAFRTDFTGATGRAWITAPTSPQDSNSGIWFAEPGAPPGPGLKNLPALPPQWRYEGWVVVTFIPAACISTGKFARADTADLDGAGPWKGPGSGYNLPGQDFVVVTGVHGRIDLTEPGLRFEVTIEPFPDNDPAPFFLRLLSSEDLAIPIQSRTRLLTNIIRSSAPTARLVVTR